jgi:cell division protease FtsH
MTNNQNEQKQNPNPNTGKNPKKQSPQAAKKRGPFGWLMIAILVFTGMMMYQQWQQSNKIKWNEFVDHANNGDIKQVTIKDTEITGKYTEKFLADKEQQSETFLVYYKPEIHGETLEKVLSENNIPNDTAPPPTWLYNLISMLLPIILLVGIFYFLFARNMRGGAGGMLMSFGRSKHRLQGKDRVKVSFKDVAGIQEAKDEVTEIIEFLKNPKKFQKLGGRIPRGVLLAGPPGCGKTLLAKSIAGEAEVPFFSISGSDFVEMFVGVGASRVRDLFNQAKQNSPCIIFLDEIDAIGRKRGAGFASSGGHDEREQTLNAILVEMDGFDTNDQVIVVAATNRSDMLDKALTRPGRFDRQVVVPLPDLKGRLEILNIHAKKIKLSPDADLERLARGTPMFTGADLAAIINEAALLATMSNKEDVETEDLEEARDKVRWGRARKSRVIDKYEKKITGYHESGHAFVQYMLEDADPLHKVSVIPRGPMGGATFALPEKDRTMFTKKYCMALMQVCFGGRIAEKLFFDDISSGAQSDILQATKLAKQMVLSWGMSDELGPISYAREDNGMLAFANSKDYSEKTAEEIDKEVRKLTEKAYSSAKKLIEENKDKVEAMSEALLKYETLDVEDVKLILSGGKLDKPTVNTLLEEEKFKQEDNQQDDSNNEDTSEDNTDGTANENSVDDNQEWESKEDKNK